MRLLTSHRGTTVITERGYCTLNAGSAKANHKSPYSTPNPDQSGRGTKRAADAIGEEDDLMSTHGDSGGTAVNVIAESDDSEDEGGGFDGEVGDGEVDGLEAPLDSETGFGVSLEVGDRLQALDSYDLWYNVKVIDVNDTTEPRRVKVHYQGWKARFDEWIVVGQGRLRLPGQSSAARPVAEAYPSRPPAQPNSTTPLGASAAFSTSAQRNNELARVQLTPPAPLLPHQSPSASIPLARRACERLLNLLCFQPEAEPFLQPIDHIALELRDYRFEVTSPQLASHRLPSYCKRTLRTPFDLAQPSS